MGNNIYEYCVRKCCIADLDILVNTRIEFLRESGHVKYEQEVNDLKNEISEYIEMHLNKDLHFWVVIMENETLATGAISIWNKLPVSSRKGSNRIGYFSNMYTRPEYRKKGIATCLMKHMLQFLKEEDVPKAMLHALEDGKGVYGRSGFTTNQNHMEMKIE